MKTKIEKTCPACGEENPTLERDKHAIYYIYCDQCDLELPTAHWNRLSKQRQLLEKICGLEGWVEMKIESEIAEAKQIMDKLKSKRTLVIPKGMKPQVLSLAGETTEKALRQKYGIKLVDYGAVDCMFEIDEDELEKQIATSGRKNEQKLEGNRNEPEDK